MHEGASRSPDFDQDVLSAPADADIPHADIRQIITLIARASHDIADLVSLGQLPPLPTPALTPESDARSIRPSTSSTARRVLLDHLNQGRVKKLSCKDEVGTIELDPDGLYTVTIDPLEGLECQDANLPFGTIFSISSASEAEQLGPIEAAGFIHYGPQTNLVVALATGVHIFNLDRAARTYRLAAEDVRLPDREREWSIDVTKRGRWPSSIRALIDEELERADETNDPPASVRWTGSLTSDAYRILRHGGIYLCPMDMGHEESCPNFVHAARPVAFVIEQAGGKATTGSQRILVGAAQDPTQRVPMIFGSTGLVQRIERLHALPESRFDSSPLFHRRGLFWT